MKVRAFKIRNFLEALKFYKRALRKGDVSQQNVIYLNMAATYLALGRYYEAYQEANKALESGGDKEKSLFR